MKIERFAGHHEAREALVLSIAGVTAIMLIESLILLISLAWRNAGHTRMLAGVALSHGSFFLTASGSTIVLLRLPLAYVTCRWISSSSSSPIGAVPGA
jgi:hypothetical protein